VSFRCLTIAEIKTHCLFDCIEACCNWNAFGLHNSRPNLAEDDLFDWCSKVKLLSHGNISFIFIYMGDLGSAE
jgi:hypothetical protein